MEYQNICEYLKSRGTNLPSVCVVTSRSICPKAQQGISGHGKIISLRERLMVNEDKASWRAQDARCTQGTQRQTASDKKPERGEDSPSTG